MSSLCVPRPFSPYLSRRITIAMASLLLACGPFAPSSLRAEVPLPSVDRSIWFWQSPDSPFGSSAIVGNASKEDAAIARLKAWGVTTLYGSYSAAEPHAALRSWNHKLRQNGITSYLLLSETEDLFPERWPAASDNISADFLKFNRDAKADERFAGLAFDIEPHIFPGSAAHPGWKAADVITRRQYMTDLLQFFQRTRLLLDHNGERNAKIEATLPVWYSKVAGSIQWNNAMDRDEWFAQLTKACDRLSIMAFEVPSAARILQRSQEEVGLLHGRSRIALRANLGDEWQSLDDFWTATRSVEASTHQGIDIQDFARLAAEQDAAKAGLVPAPSH